MATIEGELIAEGVARPGHGLRGKGIYRERFLRRLAGGLSRQSALDLRQVDQASARFGHVAQPVEDELRLAFAGERAVEEPFERQIQLISKAAESPSAATGPVLAQRVACPGVVNLQETRHRKPEPPDPRPSAVARFDHQAHPCFSTDSFARRLPRRPSLSSAASARAVW